MNRLSNLSKLYRLPSLAQLEPLDLRMWLLGGTRRLISLKNLISQAVLEFLFNSY